MSASEPRAVAEKELDRVLGTKHAIKSRNGTFIINFDNPTDINLFRNAKRGNIIKTNEFIKQNCKFSFDITPNGWGQTNNTLIWLVLHELPNGVNAIKVRYTWKSKVVNVGFCEEKVFIITTPLLALKYGGLNAFSTDKSIQFLLFQCMNSFSFECEIKILEFYDKENIKIDPSKLGIATEVSPETMLICKL